MIEGENYAGFPHLCHRNPEVYAAMFKYARMLIEELGFDGFRFDFAKGFGAWMIGLPGQVPVREGRHGVHSRTWSANTGPAPRTSTAGWIR